MQAILTLARHLDCAALVVLIARVSLGSSAMGAVEDCSSVRVGVFGQGRLGLGEVITDHWPWFVGFLVLLGVASLITVCVARLNRKLRVALGEKQRELEDRNQAQEALRQSHDQLQTVFNGMFDGLVIADVQTKRFVAANLAMCAMLGYSERELRSLSVHDIHPADALPDALEKFTALAKGRLTLVESLPVLRKDRSVFYADISALVIVYNGRPSNIGIFRDVTHRKQAEERQARLLGRLEGVNRLQEELILPGSLEEKVKKIADAAVDLLDLDFCRIWIMKPGDLCSTGCVHAAATDPRHTCRRRDNCLHLMASSGRYTHTDGNHRRVPIGCYKIGRIASAEEREFRTNSVTTDPQVHDHQWARSLGLVSFAGHKLRDTNDDPVGVLAMFAKHLLSEEDDAFLSSLAETTTRVILRHQAAEELREAEGAARRENAKLSSMISGMEEGVVFADADNVIVEINDYLCRFLGNPRSEILGRRIEDFHQGPPLENIVRQIDRFRSRAGCDPFVLQRPIGDAEVIFRMQPIYRDGRYDGVLLNIIDVSELVEARRQAETATRTKSRFLANMSHEIRTPMTAILGYADLLMDSTLSPSTRNDYLTVIRRSGEHLLQLINDILDLSKIEAGRMSLDVQRLDVMSLLAEVTSMMRPRAAERGVSLAVTYAGRMPETISTDGGRLRQALVNLVDNAVKFTERGSVRIVGNFLADWRDGRPAVRIQVIDTGIGIRKEVLPQLFQPFSQGDATTSRQFGGTGLGLAISHHIAEMLEGELTAESEWGRGSTFTLIIPTGDLGGVKMLQDPAEVRQDPHGDPPPPLSDDLKGVRILLAEDGFDNQEVIRAMLRTAGAEVEISEDGRSAVAKAQSEPFDVVLMDMNMPLMDGYEATRTLRDQGYARPILALTANAISGDKERCLAAGCNDYLVKPIDRTRMVRTIAAHVGHQNAENEAVETGTAPAPGEPVPGAPDREGETIVSQFAGEPEMAEILASFVQRLPDQVAAMRESLAVGKYEHLQRLAHGMKGSGGSYGYPSLTEACRMLEHAVRANEIEAAPAALDRVAAVCQAIQKGYVPCATAGSAIP